jgi:hypothetical protein
VSVQAQLRAPWRIAANFQEQRAEVGVIDVEVVVVDVDRLAALELKPPVHLLPAERMRLLLSYPNENDPIPHLPLPAEVVGDVVFPLFVIELVNRYAFSRGLGLDRFAESLRDLPEHRRGWKWLPQLEAHEHA